MNMLHFPPLCTTFLTIIPIGPVFFNSSGEIKEYTKQRETSSSPFPLQFFFPYLDDSDAPDDYDDPDDYDASDVFDDSRIRMTAIAVIDTTAIAIPRTMETGIVVPVM